MPAGGPPAPALVEDITARIRVVRDRIVRAAQRAGRDPDTVRLLAVSKRFGEEHLRAAAAAGLTDLGENRVQEALGKMDALPELPVAWHLIGHLQSNKAKRAAPRFAWIHSIDSLDLVRRLDRAAGEAGVTPNALIQVDLAGEATKHGVPVDDLRPVVDEAAGCQHLRLRGLMTMPPRVDAPDDARPYFRRLRELRDDLVAGGIEPHQLAALSMGMSHDLEPAVEEGATFVRVGTGVFGPRPVPA